MTFTRRLASLLPAAFLLFVAAAFALPSEPAYSLVFFIAVLPPALAALALPASGTGEPEWHQPGWAACAVLIAWSALTLLWGQDDGHRSMRFALSALMTLVYADVLSRVLQAPKIRFRLAAVLIWLGAANALLSMALSPFEPQNGDRLHGWGATSHPILGASVMTVAYLAALSRALTEPRSRGPHLAAAAIMALFLLLTGSRGPLLAAACATLFLCAAGPWRLRALGVLAGLAIVWRLMPAGFRHHQAAVLVARGASHRFEIWHRTLQMVAAHPLLGNGLAANLDLKGMTFPHDLYLSVLFYSGAVGLLLFTGLAAIVTLRLWEVRGTGGPDRLRTDWLWITALWINTLLSGLTDLGQITKGPGPMWFIFWLPVGLVLSRPAPATARLAAPVTRPAAA